MRARRNVGQKIPSAYVVTDRGDIKRLYYTNEGGALTKVGYTDPSGNRVVRVDLSNEYRARRWALLADLYAQDSREEIRRRGLEVYAKHDAAIARRDQGTRKPISNGRLAPEPIDDGWLPEEVLARRAGTSAVSAPVYEAPAPPTAPKPKRARG